MDLTILLLATNLVSHAAFIWGRYRVFRIDNRAPAGVRLIEVSATTCILAGLWLIVTRDEVNSGWIHCGPSRSANWIVCSDGPIHRRRLTAALSRDVATEPNRRSPHSGSFAIPFCFLIFSLIFRSS